MEATRCVGSAHMPGSLAARYKSVSKVARGLLWERSSAGQQRPLALYNLQWRRAGGRTIGASERSVCRAKVARTGGRARAASSWVGRLAGGLAVKTAWSLLIRTVHLLRAVVFGPCCQFRLHAHESQQSDCMPRTSG